MKRDAIPLRVIIEVCSDPCAVCGVPYHLQCDHLRPIAWGGSNDRDNLQSLCKTCNQKKKDRMTNAQLTEWVSSCGERHFLMAVYRWDVRYRNDYDGYGFDQWRSAQSDRVNHALELHQSFINRTHSAHG